MANGVRWWLDPFLLLRFEPGHTHTQQTEYINPCLHSHVSNYRNCSFLPLHCHFAYIFTHINFYFIWFVFGWMFFFGHRYASVVVSFECNLCVWMFGNCPEPPFDFDSKELEARKDRRKVFKPQTRALITRTYNGGLCWPVAISISGKIPSTWSKTRQKERKKWRITKKLQ